MIQKIWSIFKFSQCKFVHLVKKSRYQSIMQFLIHKQKKFFLMLLKTISIWQTLTYRLCATLHIWNHKFYQLLYLIIYFLLSMFMNITFQFPEYKSNLNKSNIHTFNSNLYICLVFKARNVCFSFHVLYSLPYVWNLVVVS